MKNLGEALPILRSNLVHHAQVTVDPFNISQVNFNYLQKVISETLKFNVYNLMVKIGKSSRANGGNWPTSSFLES
ncbi:hypothetical protein J1N35_019232 [Gossypium stocksii]|uniref:Uncharacterized protein n=1 Tax=Gossypium stocksii TaxID=47602 RepID=A0A9D4A7Y1_9ROSI|nr:hypothetical protein J1N35_019232 [Gossypium stocksii]